MKAKLSPSMMCAGLNGLTGYLNAFKQNGIEYLHIDVMDGAFVPNYALGVDYVKRLRQMTDIPLDIHLMVERPEDKLNWFKPRLGDMVSVHVESTAHIQRAIDRIKETGAAPCVALNPGTHYKAVEYVLNDINAVLVMTVNPGYAGQVLIEQTINKINDLRKWLDGLGYRSVEIEVDGNVSFINAGRMRQAGANIFVAGSSSVFDEKLELPGAILKLREAVG